MNVTFKEFLLAISILLLAAASRAQESRLTLYLEEGKSGTLWDLALSGDETKLFTCGRDSTAKIWNLRTGEVIRTFRLPDAAPNICLALSAGDSILAVGDARNRIQLWRCATGELIDTISAGGDGYVTDLLISRDGSIASSHRDGKVRIRAPEGRLLREFTACEPLWVNAIALSSNGELIATAGQDGSVRLWNTGDGTLRAELGTHSRFVRCVCFSRDDAYLFSGGQDGMVKVWDVAKGKFLRAMKMTGGAPHHLALTRDGSALIVSSMNSLIETWDWNRGQLLREYEARSYGAMAAVVNRDASRLFSAHTDGSVKVWNYPFAAYMLSMVGFSDGHWISFTQDGYFDCSSLGSRYAQWKQDTAFYPFELYDEIFHKPSVIEDALSGRYEARSSLAKVAEPPKAAFLAPRDKQLFSFGTEPLQMVVELASTDRKKLAGQELLLNGRVLQENQILERKVMSESDTSDLVRYTVEVLPGRNVLEGVAYNIQKIRSDPARVTVDVETQRTLEPNLFVLAVGIDGYAPAFPDLHYAALDARDLAAALAKQEGKLFTRVYSSVLTDREATKENIFRALERFPAMTPKDMLILFFSGHGVRARNAKGETKYFYASAGAAAETMLQRGLGWEEFAQKISRVNAGRVLLFLDACHSGDMSNGASNEKVAASIARQMGIVFASSSGNEYSFENPDWGHGAFTKAILDGLGGAADYTKDGKVDWSELQLYVISAVREMTKGGQNPTIPRLEQFSNFDLVRLQ